MYVCIYVRLSVTALFQYLAAILERSDLDVNTLDRKTGEAPLHALVKKDRKDRINLVLVLLINSNADIHLKTSRGLTPLHLAVEVRDVEQ